MKKFRKLATIGFVGMVLTLRIASGPTANISYLLLAGYAFCGRVQAIQALALSWLFTMLSSGIAAEATFLSAGRYVVFSAAATSIILHNGFLVRSLKIGGFTLSTMLMGIFLIGHSVIFSPIADVSVLKAVSWTIVMSTLIAAWIGLKENERDTLERQIFGGLVLLMIASLPLLAFQLGYLRSGTGFQGVLNHPQAFGPTMALLGAWAASRMFGQKQPSWSSMALACACLMLTILSEARTAGLAMVFGIGAAMLTQGLSGRSMHTVLPGLYSKRVQLVGALSLIGIVILGAQLGNIVTNFLSKSGRAEASSIMTAYEDSRGNLMKEMWMNIADKPLQGIGFGIASDPASMVIFRDPVLGLPTSAAIEKGVLPLAVLEEVGIIGFIVVSVWVWLLLRRSSSGGVAPVAVVCTGLLLNMGESTLFSPGGFGLLLLVLLSWAFARGQSAGGRC